MFLTLAARGGHAVPAGALRAAPHAVAATPVWLAAVFAVAGLTVISLTRTVARAPANRLGRMSAGGVRGRRGTKVLERIPGGGVGSGQGCS